MNLPNKLTIFRTVMIIPFIICLLGSGKGWFGSFSYANYVALAIFIICCLTDLLDGKIARRYNLITNFGKLMDPLADKILVCGAMVVLVEFSRIPSWVVVIIISREFVISGFRLIAAESGVVISASYWGKFKTTFQMIMVCLLIADIEVLGLLTDIVMWIAVILTVVSLADYIWKNRDIMKEEK